MEYTVTANEVSGRATGVLFFTGFGMLWLLIALYLRESLKAGPATAVVSICVALALAAWMLMRRAKQFPRKAESPQMSRAFHRINALQWIAVFVVCTVLGRMHLAVYSVSAVACIVGLHMFPLARVFGYRPHIVTGALLVLWSAGVLVFIPAERLQSVTAMGTGIILLASAAMTLALTWDKTRGSSLAMGTRAV